MKGVRFYNPLNKWRAYMDGKHLGYFKKKSDAIKARKEAENTKVKKTRSNTKLKEPIVKHIRECKGRSKVLAIDYGVHISTIHSIRNNKTWRHV